MLHSKCRGVDPQQERSLDPVHELGSAAHVHAGLGDDVKGEGQLSGSCGIVGGVGPLVLVEMVSKVESAGVIRDAISHGLAAIHAIGIDGTTGVAYSIADASVNKRATSEGTATIVAIGGIGGIGAELIAFIGAHAQINRCASRIIVSCDILKDESEIAKVGLGADQILEGIVSNLAAQTTSYWEGLHIVIL